MGVLPLQFMEGNSRQSLALTGSEKISVLNLEKGIKARMTVRIVLEHENGQREEVDTLCRIDTQDEVEYFVNGGILCYVLRNLVK
jgi:aconitate hydratase